ncbi:hypothetical protein [Streptomyces sp. NPDC001380]|uniref:hypothetical protein n=1 Tax=Streptomyces sp. NPDC001380 TaxID=3364566 RepID=UPI0036C4E23F
MNYRSNPSSREAELLKVVDQVLSSVDPVGMIRDESFYFLRLAPEGGSNVEVTLVISYGRDVPLRIISDGESIRMGWGGEIGDPFTVETFSSESGDIKGFIKALGGELSRAILKSRRRVIFGGSSELHINVRGEWVDLLRGGVPSEPKYLKKAKVHTNIMGE